MAWPETPLTTYVSQSTPAIKASDLNSIQSGINQLYGTAIGKTGYLLQDDFDYGASGVFWYNFLGPIVPADARLLGKFQVVLGVSYQLYLDPFVSASVPSGSAGLVTFVNANGAATGTASLVSGLLNIGTADFHISCRVRVKDVLKLANLANGAGLNIGISDVGASKTIMFGAGKDDTHWRVMAGGVNNVTSVLVGANTFYNLELIRVSGVLTAYINGNSVYTAANTDNFVGCDARMFLTGIAVTTGVEYASIDYYRLWFAR